MRSVGYILPRCCAKGETPIQRSLPFGWWERIEGMGSLGRKLGSEGTAKPALRKTSA